MRMVLCVAPYPYLLPTSPFNSDSVWGWPSSRRVRKQTVFSGKQVNQSICWVSGERGIFVLEFCLNI